MKKEKFNPEVYGFEYFYETGVECPTWIFSTDDGYEHWKYIISLPYNTFSSKDDNPDIWKIQVIVEDNELASRGTVYQGLIPSRKFGDELLINLKLYYLKHVRRKLNLDVIINKK